LCLLCIITCLILRWQDEADHAGAVAARRLQGLDQALHLRGAVSERTIKDCEQANMQSIT
jgi:hypothetical protein